MTVALQGLQQAFAGMGCSTRPGSVPGGRSASGAVVAVCRAAFRVAVASLTDVALPHHGLPAEVA